MRVKIFHDKDEADATAVQLGGYVQPMLEGWWYVYIYVPTPNGGESREALFEDGQFRPFRRNHR